MTQYVYMNEQIMEAKPSRPVIVVQKHPAGDLPPVREANLFDIWHNGVWIGAIKFNPKMLDVCETHDVKAWVEFTNDVVLSTRDAAAADPAPVASAKEPNKPVKPVIDFKMRFSDAATNERNRAKD